MGAGKGDEGSRKVLLCLFVGGGVVMVHWYAFGKHLVDRGNLCERREGRQGRDDGP